METKMINGVAQFIAGTVLFPSSSGWIFRGQADASWSLKPKAGRPGYFDEVEQMEAHKTNRQRRPPDLHWFEFWRSKAIAYSVTLQNDDFECLAHAQHYGLATRLLDWTFNPLVALFFAAETCPGEPGIVFCCYPRHSIESASARIGEYPHIARYRPRPFDRRILVQASVFTYHPRPELALDESEDVILQKLILAPSEKRTILKQLRELGVHREMLFPDLQGLSDYINWINRTTVDEHAIVTIEEKG